MSTFLGQVYNGRQQNMYTMNGCGFTPYGINEKEYLLNAGLQFANLLANSIFAAKSESSDVPAAKKAATTPNAAKIKELKEKRANADAEVDKEQPNLSKDIKDAEENVRSYDKNTGIVSDCTEKIEKNNQKISSLESQIKDIPADADDNARKEIEKEIQKLKDENKELQTKQDNAQSELDKLGDPKAELEAAKKARETAITEFVKKIDAQIEKLEDEDNLYKTNQDFDAAIDAGDGAGVSRLFSPKKRQVNQFADAKRDLVAAIKSGDAAAAKVAAEKLTAEDALPNPEDSSKKDTRAAIEIANKYLSENSEILQKIKDGKLDDLKPEDKMKLGVF